MNHLSFSPTPIHKLEYYSKILGVNLWCKRDDLFAEAGGGNKARMLQYILAGINNKNCDILLTAGGPCSNFNRACALMCAKLGIVMHIVVYTDTPNDYEDSLNYKLCGLANVAITRCDKAEVVETLKLINSEYTSAGKRVKYIYGGGKSLEGVYSYYDAVKELYVANVNVDYVFAACGTGTTLAGISSGLQEFYPHAKVYAISTARTYEQEYPVLVEDINYINEYLGKEYSLQNIVFTDKFLCGGYGKYSEELFATIKECVSKEGMLIDPTYSGKAFWGMKHIISTSTEFQKKNVLFWNTGGVFNLMSILK